MVERRLARVLVTRPEPGASRTAALLKQRGFAPLVLPLTEIFPVDGFIPDHPFHAVAVTSANAARMMESSNIAKLRHAPCYAVGAQTAAACRDAGFSHVLQEGGTADALADRLIKDMPAGAGILYLCGSPRKPVLETRLRAAQCHVEAVEVYRTHRLIPAEACRGRLAETGFDAALLYSAEGARALLALLADLPAQSFSGARFICLSADVAAVLPREWQVFAAIQPVEEELLAVLQAQFLPENR
ncbi:uroporphyrinogen-III synthase [Tianweitania sediminis]|uniref:uroporphyrinogen-III synthase n=1 Tax=Tianweitania sediminis TaxID=1502156 RepID=UPI001FD83C56|nr:uroporphyrinogen-III synthase [Tianweitania sediminis]